MQSIRISMRSLTCIVLHSAGMTPPARIRGSMGNVNEPISWICIRKAKRKTNIKMDINTKMDMNTPSLCRIERSLWIFHISYVASYYRFRKRRE